MLLLFLNLRLHQGVLLRLLVLLMPEFRAANYLGCLLSVRLGFHIHFFEHLGTICDCLVVGWIRLELDGDLL